MLKLNVSVLVLLICINSVQLISDLKGTQRNLKNSRGRVVQSTTLKQVSIETEVNLELKM